MRTIDVREVRETVRRLSIRANVELRPDVLAALRAAREVEEAPLAQDLLDTLIENARVAREDDLALCQDTGFTSVFVRIGQQVSVQGGDFSAAVDEGVRLGYEQGELRKSIVKDAILDRTNTADNTPALIYTDIVSGDKLDITVMPKGAGCDNQSRLAMLGPGEGVSGVKKFVRETVEASNGRACPPLVVGVGVGGSFEMAPLLAKKALLKDLDSSERSELGQLEDELKGEVNGLGLGAMGVGGTVTALAVPVMTAPCHMASLPVAVNLSCHSLRSAQAVI